MPRISLVHLFCAFGPLCAFAQTTVTALDNTSLAGRYFFRQLEFSTDSLGNVTGSVGSLGVLTFDGTGRFTVNGLETIGTQQAVPLTGTGLYSVQSSGVMTLSNPQRNNYAINARFSPELILGSTTESGDNSFDLFAAIPAPVTGQTAGLLAGTYAGASFELQNSVAAGVRSALFAMPVAAGSIATFSATGHAANLQNGAILTQTVAGSAYALGPDGSGTISFGGSTLLLNGTKNLYVSQSGNVFLCGSPYAGGQDFVIGVRQFDGQPAVTNVSGLYWTGGLRLDLTRVSTAAYAGSLSGLGTLGQTVAAQRLHQIGLAPGFENTVSNPVAVNSDGTIGFNLDVLRLGAAGNSFVAAGLSSLDQNGYSLDIGIRAPALSGKGVYLNPQGIVNAASLALGGTAVAPGEFLSLFGSGLAADAVSASPPYPLLLGGVSVSVNGLPAPLAFVSANQINALVPYNVTGFTAALAVTNNGVVSQVVTVPLQTTAPGAFSANGSGTGLGAITHADGSLVTVANPARRGETIVVYLSGLGAVTPAVPDGTSGSATLVNRIAVTVAGQTASVVFAGLSPSFPGLYQVNVTIPANLVGSGALPLGIRTVDAFHCQVDLQLQ